MGFFSWDCKGCGHPMLCPQATEDKNTWMTDVVLMTEYIQFRGEYDGYGQVIPPGFGEGLHLGDGPEPECWHYDCWVAAGKPSYTGPSSSSEDQGWFFEDGVHNIESPLKNSVS